VQQLLVEALQQVGVKSAIDLQPSISSYLVVLFAKHFLQLHTQLI
jgi:hypothetical protein